MSALPTDILIAKAGGFKALDNKAKILLAKTAPKRIADHDPLGFRSGSPDTVKALEEILYLIDLRCFDLSEAWRLDVRSKEGIEFRDYRSLAFDIGRVLSLGETEEARVKSAIRLAAFLGPGRSEY